jgi:hypothetical protein
VLRAVARREGARERRAVRAQPGELLVEARADAEAQAEARRGARQALGGVRKRGVGQPAEREARLAIEVEGRIVEVVDAGGYASRSSTP